MKSLWGQGTRYLRVKRTVDVSPGFTRAMLIAVLVIIGLIFVAGDVGLWKLWVAQRQMKSLETKVAELKQKNALLSREIRYLKNDPFTIEKVAREKYGYARPGERVYRIVPHNENPEKDPVTPGTLDRRGGKP